MARLREPGGCPWDRVQDYDSVKGLLLEEAYEVVDAVRARDFSALREELGDLLFQVVFYSRLAEEDKRFAFGDVAEGVYSKLVRRHPHVFGDVKARTAEEALRSWNEVKEAERKSNPGDASKPASILDGIADALPSTLEAHELGLRVAEVGFDWPSTEALLNKVEEEVQELRHEVRGESAVDSLAAQSDAGRQSIEEEIGDLMFSAANLARYFHFDAESCLRAANQKFKRRFQALEDEVANQGKRLRECTAAELDSIWVLVKSREEK